MNPKSNLNIRGRYLLIGLFFLTMAISGAGVSVAQVNNLAQRDSRDWQNEDGRREAQEACRKAGSYENQRDCQIAVNRARYFDVSAVRACANLRSSPGIILDCLKAITDKEYDPREVDACSGRSLFSEKGVVECFHASGRPYWRRPSDDPPRRGLDYDYILSALTEVSRDIERGSRWKPIDDIDSLIRYVESRLRSQPRSDHDSTYIISRLRNIRWYLEKRYIREAEEAIDNLIRELRYRNPERRGRYPSALGQSLSSQTPKPLNPAHLKPSPFLNMSFASDRKKTEANLRRVFEGPAKRSMAETLDRVPDGDSGEGKILPSVSLMAGVGETTEKNIYGSVGVLGRLGIPFDGKSDKWGSLGLEVGLIYAGRGHYDYRLDHTLVDYNRSSWVDPWEIYRDLREKRSGEHQFEFIRAGLRTPLVLHRLFADFAVGLAIRSVDMRPKLYEETYIRRWDQEAIRHTHERERIREYDHRHDDDSIHVHRETETETYREYHPGWVTNTLDFRELAVGPGARGKNFGATYSYGGGVRLDRNFALKAERTLTMGWKGFRFGVEYNP